MRKNPNYSSSKNLGGSVPVLTKPGYSCTPSIIDLQSFTVKELSQVENFTLENEHAKVRFLQPVDLRDLNLDQIIDFNYRSVSIYSHETFSDSQRSVPMQGDGINVQAEITYKNF